MPGLLFQNSDILIYDDSSAITATLDLNPNGEFTIGDFEVIKEE